MRFERNDLWPRYQGHRSKCTVTKGNKSSSAAAIADRGKNDLNLKYEKVTAENWTKSAKNSAKVASATSSDGFLIFHSFCLLTGFRQQLKVVDGFFEVCGWNNQFGFWHGPQNLRFSTPFRSWIPQAEPKLLKISEQYRCRFVGSAHKRHMKREMTFDLYTNLEDNKRLKLSNFVLFSCQLCPNGHLCRQLTPHELDLWPVEHKAANVGGKFVYGSILSMGFLCELGAATRDDRQTNKHTPRCNQ